MTTMTTITTPRNPPTPSFITPSFSSSSRWIEPRQSSRSESGPSRPRPRIGARYVGGTGYSRSSTVKDLTNDDDDNYDVKRLFRQGGLPHVPPELLVFESPPPPDADINVYPDPNAPWGKTIICPNTPAKCASSIQVWYLAGLISWIAPEHLKRCDKY